MKLHKEIVQEMYYIFQYSTHRWSNWQCDGWRVQTNHVIFNKHMCQVHDIRNPTEWNKHTPAQKIIYPAYLKYDCYWHELYWVRYIIFVIQCKDSHTPISSTTSKYNPSTSYSPSLPIKSSINYTHCSCHFFFPCLDFWCVETIHNCQTNSYCRWPAPNINNLKEIKAPVF